MWDDSVYVLMQHSGGRCLEKDEAEDVLLEGGHDLEMITVPVSHDGASGSGRVSYMSGQRLKLHQLPLFRTTVPPYRYSTVCEALRYRYADSVRCH